MLSSTSQQAVEDVERSFILCLSNGSRLLQKIFEQMIKDWPQCITEKRQVFSFAIKYNREDKGCCSLIYVHICLCMCYWIFIEYLAFSQNILFYCLFKACSQSVFVCVFFPRNTRRDTCFNIGSNDVSCHIKVDSDKLPLQEKNRFFLVDIQKTIRILPLDKNLQVLF